MIDFKPRDNKHWSENNTPSTLQYKLFVLPGEITPSHTELWRRPLLFAKTPKSQNILAHRTVTSNNNYSFGKFGTGASPDLFHRNKTTMTTPLIVMRLRKGG